MMKTVILDGYTINPGDLSWEAFNEFGEVAIYDRTLPHQRLERCRDAQIAITSKVVFDRELLEQLPELRYIGVIATGYNVVDLEYTRERSIVVTYIPNYCTGSVAQMVFAHILELCRRTAHHSETVRQGRWSRAEDFCYWDYPQVELTGKTLGLIGCGHIGRAVARIGRAMDMNVIAYDLFPRKSEGIEFTDLDTVFRTADVLSLHCPLTDETAGIINRDNLRKMKSTAFLVNTGRGPLVNEADLAVALTEGRIGGAGLDVLAVEPPTPDNPLLSAPNCYFTPHIAWAAKEAREHLIRVAADNVRAFLAGKPVNVVNGL